MANYVYDQESGELYHYGVKGMRWGVRRDRLQKSAQKTAKKLATLKAKEYSKAKNVATTMNVMNYTNSYGNRKMQRILAKQTKDLDKASRKAQKFLDKCITKYKNTKYSDIHISDPEVRNGRTYCYTAMGFAGTEDGGSSLFNVTAGSSVKNRS